MRRPGGSTLALLLLVLALLLVVLVAVIAIGARHSSLVQANLASTAGVQAAEAGIHASLHALKGNINWNAGFSGQSLGGELQQRFSVAVTNNFQGSGPVTAADGVTVPAGQIYLVSTGTCKNGAISRKVAVFVIRGMTFAYAIATGGDAEIKAAGNLYGNIKSNSDLTISAKIKVIPVEGQGRLLSAGNLSISGGVAMDPTQDVRVRGTIDNPGKISGTTMIYFPDSSPATEPFVMDGSLTPGPVGSGEVMPNPNMSEVLIAGQYTDHAAETEIKGTLDLQGGVHYFPQGIRFAPGSKVVGTGTIVVGNAKKAIFDINLDNEFDVLAVDGQNGTVGGAEIQFNGSTRLRGLVFCHGSIFTKADFRVDGRVITYGTGNYVHTGAHMDVQLDPVADGCPGFDAFLGPEATPANPVVESWQRL